MKLKLQFFGHLIQRADSLEKTLGKTEGRKRSGQQRKVRLHHELNGHEFEQTLGDSEGPKKNQNVGGEQQLSSTHPDSLPYMPA